MCLGWQQEGVTRAGTYASSSVVKGPDGGVEIDLVAKVIGEWRPLCDG